LTRLNPLTPLILRPQTTEGGRQTTDRFFQLRHPQQMAQAMWADFWPARELGWRPTVYPN
jgi:hypothetical protein